ncbi:PadR family transcriptional regulator [Alkalicella caledoniensis]|uniref:PadR family transcriptional regulator n=1 Tax=Alkalicella caledoniensis TaxID=2731377 RepID=UPI0031B595A0
MDKVKKDTLLDGLIQELRRGTIVLSVMSQLNKPQYGYSLVVCLKEKGIEVDSGTLYPLLRRLESQGLLESSWDVESSKPRKYYQLNKCGEEVYDKLRHHWYKMTEKMNELLE